MQSMSIRRRLLAIVGVLMLVAVACGDDAATDTTQAPEGTTATTAAPGTTAAPATTAPAEPFNVSIGLSEPPFIDPQLVEDSEGFEVARVVFNGLTLYSPEGSGVVPGVAESWEFNADKTVWTFYLRDDSFYSNGEQVVAQDFVYGWSRLADPDLASRVAYHGDIAGITGFGDIEGGEASGVVGDELVPGVKAIDDFTLEVSLDFTNSLLPKILAHPAFSPVSQSTLEADPEGWAEMPIGNGPYAMTGPWQHDVGIFLERNDGFYGTPGIPDTIEYRILSTSDAQFQQVQDGSLDFMRGVPNEQVEAARIDFGDRYQEQATGSFTYIGLPQPQFASKEIRQAMSLAVDVEAIADRILIGRTAATGFVPPVAPGAVLDACPYCTYDPEMAQTLFEQGGGLDAIGGELTISFNAGAGHEEWVEAAANDMARNLGVEVNFQSLEWAAYLDWLFGGDVIPGPFRLGWGWDYPSGYNFLAPLYQTGSTDNLTGFSNADLDAALDKVIQANTEEEGLPFLEEAQRIVGEEIPVIPIVFGQARYVYGECIDNVIYTDFSNFLVEYATPSGAC